MPSDSWAVVTGASDGIGHAIARRLAIEHVNLVLVARREPRLREIADDLSHTHGIATRVVAIDLRQPDAAGVIVDRTADLDVETAILAAGFGAAAAFLDTPLDVHDEMIAVNVTAVTALCHALGRRMADRGGGSIVLFGSLLGWHGVPGQVGYAATKAYVQSLAEGLRGELTRRNISVLAVAPGPVHSGFARRAGMSMSFADTPEAVAATTVSALGRSASVVPGWRGRLLTSAMSTLPRRVRIVLLGHIVTGMRTPPSR